MKHVPGVDKGLRQGGAAGPPPEQIHDCSSPAVRPRRRQEGTVPHDSGPSRRELSQLESLASFKGLAVGDLARALLGMSEGDVRQLIEDYCTAH